MEQEDPAPMSHAQQAPSSPRTAESTLMSCHLAVHRSEDEVGALRQVAVDVPRTAPGVAFFHEPAVQKCLERILYIWGVRYPAWLGSQPCSSAACSSESASASLADALIPLQACSASQV